MPVKSEDIQKRNAKIVALYHSGLLIKEIAAQVGMAPNSINPILSNAGIVRPKKPQRRWHGKENRATEAVGLWKEGLCVSQIAERMGESAARVDKWLREMRVDRSSSRRLRYDGIGTIGRASPRRRKDGA